MELLSNQQIKKQELILLETPGLSLANYTKSQTEFTLFKQLHNFTKIGQLQRLKIETPKAIGSGSNSNVTAFVLALLASVYSCEIKQDLLAIIKSSLYHTQLDLSSIKNHPLPNLSNKHMKKIVVQFLYSLEYSNEVNKVESKLSRYPVIVDIFILYIRKILIASKVANADDYASRIPTTKLCEILISYFDLNCKIMESLYIFYEDKVFIYENTMNEMVFGTYIENDIPKTVKSLLNNNLPDLEVVQQGTQNGISPRPSMDPNRSLQLKGLVSQSIVFQPESDTPFFNYQTDNRSFSQSSEKITNSLIEEEKQSNFENSMRASRQMSLLKLMDRSPLINPNNKVFGNAVKRTIIENQLKQSLQCKQYLGNLIDSPITQDSPHTMFSAANFGSLRMEQAEEQIRGMKRSKSESDARRSMHIANIEQQVLNNYSMKKNEKVEYGKPLKLDYEKCHCHLLKKKAMKIASNIYEINMKYVKNITNNHPVLTMTPFDYIPCNSILDTSQGSTYVNSKGISYEWYVPAPAPIFPLQPFLKRQAEQKDKTPLDTSLNSCYVVPNRIFRESESNSKRSFSPFSNIDRERSLSPITDKPTKTPKITFTYRNPVKCSTQRPNTKIKQSN